MKRGLLILIAAILLGIGMFYGSRTMLPSCGCEDTSNVPTENGSLLPELEWLRHSLALTDAQFEKVKALHLAYQPRCEELCARVHRSNQALLKSSSDSRKVEGDVQKHLRERADLTMECQQAMLKHVYETAACMDEKQAAKYLKLVLPNAFGLDPSRADGVHSHN
ncbi:hypothetical protein [Prosthecobacter sp.]|uniref:hypothetical protein n=1 Tax=Prosthecobacter sp. TaxID=1965333 RepID=UPI001D242342|nr:hypothetical protein [Prosthecobacter sp.]MCB1279407.1 hypothetical protein [Prosthecobacter sp.]